MLRNASGQCPKAHPRPLLNEVLSLNAQESTTRTGRYHNHPVLNEVLSLNAQELYAKQDVVGAWISSMNS